MLDEASLDAFRDAVWALTGLIRVTFGATARRTRAGRAPAAGDGRRRCRHRPPRPRGELRRRADLGAIGALRGSAGGPRARGRRRRHRGDPQVVARGRSRTSTTIIAAGLAGDRRLGCEPVAPRGSLQRAPRRRRRPAPFPRRDLAEQHQRAAWHQHVARHSRQHRLRRPPEVRHVERVDRCGTSGRRGSRRRTRQPGTPHVQPPRARRSACAPSRSRTASGPGPPPARRPSGDRPRASTVTPWPQPDVQHAVARREAQPLDGPGCRAAGRVTRGRPPARLARPRPLIGSRGDPAPRTRPARSVRRAATTRRPRGRRPGPCPPRTGSSC